ncbi:Zinc finger protein 717, partial [Galemys pyrenaicus]
MDKSQADGPEMRTDVPSQEMVSFEDVTVNITWEEWQELNDAQRTLFREVTLETYSHLVSLGEELPRHTRVPALWSPLISVHLPKKLRAGHGANYPEVSKRLEQGAQPWTVEEPPSQKLSDKNWSCADEVQTQPSLKMFIVIYKMVFFFNLILDVHTMDYMIKANPKNQVRHWWKVLTGNNKISSNKRTDTGENFNLDSDHTLIQSIKIGTISSRMPENSSIHRNSFTPGDPHEEHDGTEEEIFQRFRESLSHQGIQHFQQSSEFCEQGKVVSKETIFSCRGVIAEGTACKYSECGDNSDKSAFVVQGQTPCTCTESGEPPDVKPVCLNTHGHGEGEQEECYESEPNLSHKFYTHQHESAQLGGNNFEYHRYGEMSSQTSVLTEHQKLQADDQPFGRGEAYESSLHSRYQRTLTTEKLFDSKNYVKAFSWKTALTLQPQSQTEMKHFSAHLRTHTSETSYECQEYSKTFSCRPSLNKYERTHTGERRYESRDCGRTPYHKSDLDKYKKSHKEKKGCDRLAESAFRCVCSGAGAGAVAPAWAAIRAAAACAQLVSEPPGVSAPVRCRHPGLGCCHVCTAGQRAPPAGCHMSWIHPTEHFLMPGLSWWSVAEGLRETGVWCWLQLFLPQAVFLNYSSAYAKHSDSNGSIQVGTTSRGQQSSVLKGLWARVGSAHQAPEPQSSTGGGGPADENDSSSSSSGGGTNW